MVAYSKGDRVRIVRKIEGDRYAMWSASLDSCVGGIGEIIITDNNRMAVAVRGRGSYWFPMDSIAPLKPESRNKLLQGTY